MTTPIYNVTPAFVNPRGTDKIWSMFSHLSSFVGLPFLLPVVVYLAMRGDSDYIAANAREALNFHLSLLLYTLACIPLIFVFGLGGFLMGVLAVILVIFSIVAAWKCSNGECYRYPITIRFVK